MSHSDDNGLVLPPKLAPYQVVIIPIYKNEEQLQQINEKVAVITERLKSLGISVKYDNSDNKKPGWKFSEYELKGVPVRLALGGRDLENDTIEVARRDTLTKETVSCEGIEHHVKALLEEIQENIYRKAADFRIAQTREVNSYDEFKVEIEKGGFLLCHWDGTPETEALIKDETKATIRCIPIDGDKTPGRCMVTGKPSAQRVILPEHIKFRNGKWEQSRSGSLPYIISHYLTSTSTTQSVSLGIRPNCNTIPPATFVNLTGFLSMNNFAELTCLSFIGR